MKPLQFLIFLMIGTLFFCQQSESPSTKKTDPLLHIKIAPVQRMDMIDTVRIYGEVKLRQEAMLASQFDGRLTDFSLLLGDRVKNGEKIGTVIPPQREALLQVMNQIDASLQPMLEQQIKSIPLFSSIDGVVLAVHHHSGDVLQKGETIVHIGDLRQLDVHGDLPLRHLSRVRQLKTIRVSFVSYPHDPLALPIEAIGGKVDEAKQTVPIRLGLDNRSSEFRPGMLVQLTFPGHSHPAALTIPRAALLEEEGVYSTFVMHGSQVEKRNITVGILQDDFVEVLSGISDGEKVATQKAYSLTDGMEVVVE
jgi:multidrug efflux pump subunit AcrA (membrane-fusion protein)